MEDRRDDFYDDWLDCIKQDLEDGTALRRLREALPDGWTFDVFPAPTSGDVIVEVWAKSNAFQGANGSAPTIAKAADRCRAALARGSREEPT